MKLFSGVGNSVLLHVAHHVFRANSALDWPLFLNKEKNVFHVSQIKPTANTRNIKKENTYSYTKLKTYKHFDVFLITKTTEWLYTL